MPRKKVDTEPSQDDGFFDARKEMVRCLALGKDIELGACEKTRSGVDAGKKALPGRQRSLCRGCPRRYEK